MINQDAQYLPSPDQAQQLYEMGQLDEPTAKKLGARIDPAFVDATIQAESSGRADVEGPVTRSGKRAQGLMQVMPATGAEVAQQLGMQKYDLKNKYDNKAIGTEYLAQQMDKYGNPVLASAAYNAGPGAVDRAIEKAQKAGINDSNGVLQFLPKETQAYVPKVMQAYQERVGGTIEPEESLYAGNPTAKVLDVVSSTPSPADSTPDPFTMRSEAIEYGSNVGVQKAQEEGAYLRERANQQEQILQEQQQKEAQRQEQIKEQELKAQQALDEFANSKVDPERFWKTKGTSDKIIAGIAIALGALGQGLTKSNSNQALDIINNQIDRDLEAQKIEILSKKEAASGATGILAQMRARFDDERVAENMARVIGLDQAKLKLEEIAAKSRSGEVAANRDLLMAQIEEDRQNKLIEIQKAINESVKVRTEAQKVANESPANRRQTMETLVRGGATEDQSISVEDLPEKDRERYIPGLGITVTADDAKKLKDAKSKFDKFDNLMEEMIASRKKYGAELFGTESNKQIARSKEAIGALKEVMELGALDNGVLQVVGKIVPENPSKIRFAGNMAEELQAVRDRARKNFHDKVRPMLSIATPEIEGQLKTTGPTASAVKNAK